MQPNPLFYGGFQTLEDVELEIQRELKELDHLNRVSSKIISPNPLNKPLNKKNKKIKENVPLYQAKREKNASKNGENSDFLERLMPGHLFPIQIVSQELECSHPQLKTFFQPQKTVKNPLKISENTEKTFKNNLKTSENPLKTSENLLKTSENPLKTFKNPLKLSENLQKPIKNPSKTSENHPKPSGNPSKTINTPLKTPPKPSKPPQNPLKTPSNPTFQPLLLKKSLLMASKQGSPMSRLTKTSLSTEKLQTLSQAAYSNCTFKPEINRLSSRIVGSKGGLSVPRWIQLHDMFKEQKTRNERLKSAKEAENIDPEATFKPKIAKKHYFFFDESKAGVPERNREWKERVEEKLRGQRKSMEGSDLRDCTFHPFIRKNEQIKHSHSSNELLSAPTDFNKLGIIQHFERIDQAKRIKQEKDQLLNKFNGRGWKNELTVPKAPIEHQKDPEGLRKRKNSEFMQFYEKIKPKNNSFTNFSLVLSESEGEQGPEGFELAVNNLHSQLHMLDL